MFCFQFVPFREFLGSQYGNNAQVSQAHLAREVLAEVPAQVTGFMKKRGFKPKAPPPPVQTPAGPTGDTQPSAPTW